MNKKLLAILTALLVVVIGITLLILLGPRHVNVSQVIPEDALAYISLPHLRSSWGRIKENKSWKDLEDSKPGSEFLQEIEEGKGEIESEIGVETDLILNIFDKEIGIAIFDYDLKGSDPLGFLSGCMFIADIGAKRRPILEKIFETKIRTKFEADIEKTKHRGVWINKIVMPNDEFYWYTFINNLLLLSVDSSVMEKAINVYKIGSGSLSIDKKLRRLRSMPPEDINLSAYINVGRIIKLVLESHGEDEKAQIERFLTHSALKNIQLCGMELSVTERGLKNKITFLKDKPSTGAIQLLQQKPRVFEMTQLVPSNMLGFASMSLDDPSEFWQNIKSLLRNIYGRRDYRKFLEGINEFESESGLQIEDDIVGNLESEIGCILFEQGEQFVIVAEIQNEKKAKNCLAKLERLTQKEGIDLNTDEYKGYRITYAKVESNEVPCYAFVKNYLLLSINPSLIKIVIDSHKGIGSILKDNKFIKTLQQLPGENVLMCCVNFSNLPEWDFPIGQTLGALSLTGTEQALIVNLAISSFKARPKKSLFRP